MYAVVTGLYTRPVPRILPVVRVRVGVGVRAGVGVRVGVRVEVELGIGLVPRILPGVVASIVLGSKVSGPRYSTFSPPSLTVTMSGLPG